MTKEHDEQQKKHAKALEETGFWGKQGAGCMVVCPKTHRWLLNLRGEVEQPGTWGVWGGAVDDGEALLDAAVREFREESMCGVPIRIPSEEPIYVFRKDKFSYSTFIVEVDREFAVRPSKETADAQWFPLDALPDNLHFGVVAILADRYARKQLEKY